MILGLLLAAAVSLGYAWYLQDRKALRDRAPITNNGRPWRVGYYEGGPYLEYPRHLRAVAKALAEMGWVADTELPPADGTQRTQELWKAICRRMSSEYIRFVPQAYWSANWNKQRRRDNRQDVLRRLENGEIDLMIAMGTWAGVDLRDGHSVPTMVVSTTDPIQAGISNSAHDSGRDHLHAKCDPDKYIRQGRAFHNIARFKRLGVVAEDTEEGYLYANVSDLRKVGREMGFRVVVVHAAETGISDEQCRQNAARAIGELAPQVDAIWISDHRGEHPSNLPDILEPAFSHDVVTWSPLGPRHVRRGVLLGMVERDIAEVGRYHARVMAAIFHGATPRDLPQIFEDPKTLAVNLQIARRIGFHVPDSLLSVADQVYTTIEGDPNR